MSQKKGTATGGVEQAATGNVCQFDYDKDMLEHQKRALVTGGAGLIGSHIVDLLISEGWTVRILDNLEPQTHKNGKPEWVNPQAEFRQGFVQDYDTMHAALLDIDVVFHQAA